MLHFYIRNIRINYTVMLFITRQIQVLLKMVFSRYLKKILLHPDTALHVPEHEIIYYLFAIQRNVMYTLTMDEYKNSHYPLDYDDGNDISRNLIDPEDLFIRYIYLDSLKIIFSTLTPDFRDTIIFHYFYGFKYSEIACMFHISERAVKKRIAVAKKRVRTMFQKEDFL